MTKVLFFIAGMEPTEEEQGEIDAIINGQYEVGVRNASAVTAASTLEDCNYVAGSPPQVYLDEFGVWTTGAEIANGDGIGLLHFNGVNSLGQATAVVNGSSVDAKLQTGMALVTNNQPWVVPVTGVYVSTATFTVSGGNITGIVLS